MVKQLRMKGTLHLLLLLAIITMKYYADGTTILNDNETLPPLPQPETISSSPIPTPVANTVPVADPTAVPLTPLLAATTITSDRPALSFFMHDIFGGSTPSVRIVAGTVAIPNTNNKVNGIPFFKKRNGIINDSIKNGKSIPLITQGPIEQSLLFGTITVIDDEVTEGHDLGSSIIGKAQGFYLASSMDGSSHTMAFTAMFHDEDDHDEEDAISFFGVHRTAAVESHIAIVGGTGKYTNAQGYAIIQTFHHTNQYTTDGIDTLLQFSVFITQ